MGTDARVRYTKKVIRDTFFSLLREKNVKQITVTELCEKAEINRATFYKHYRDAFDLLEQIEGDALEHLRETARQIRTDNAAGHFVHLLENAQKHHQEFAVIGSEHGDPYFTRRASACLYEEIRPAILCRLSELAEEEKVMACCFLERGGSGVLEHWLETGMGEKPEAVAQLIFRLSDAVINLRA